MTFHFKKMLSALALPSLPTLASIVFGAAMMLASSAHAGLIGQSAGVGYFFPDTSTPYDQSYASPSEFTIDADDVETFINIEDLTFLLVDFSDTALHIDFFSLLGDLSFTDTPFNGLVFNLFSAPYWATSIASITSDLSGIPLVSLFQDQLSINMSGLGYHDNAYIHIEFNGVSSMPGSPVSEPPVWSLMLLTMALGLVAQRRGRRARQRRIVIPAYPR